jgi:signal transduction histidine kinase
VPAILHPLSALARTTAFRIVALTGVLYLLAAALTAAVLFWQTNEILTREALESLASEAAAFRAQAQAGGAALVKSEVEEKSRAAQGGLYYLAGEDGRKVAGNLSRWPPELSGGAGGLFRYTAETEGEGAGRLAVGVPVALGSGQVLLIARDVQSQLDFLSRIRTTALLSLGALALLGLGAAVTASRLVLGRVEDMAKTSETIMAGDLSRRIAVTGSGDELDDLARSLNAMLDRIEQLMAGLREVSENIAHDLKTPLNRLRNRAEAALREAHTVEACRRELERIIEATDEIIRTFNALLLIAKLEAGAFDESFEAFDLAALARDIAELYEPLAQQQGLELRLSAPQTLEVRANRQLIGQAIANLVDNAIKYGRPQAARGDGQEAQGSVEIALASAGDDIEVCVADHGPGIPSGDRDRVLKRFVRLEASRTRPGTGLGLSLVAAVARLHGGGVELADNRPGLKAVLRWPAQKKVG